MPKPRKLSARHRLFIVEYLKDGNASRSARAAGYKGRHSDTVGPRLLTRVGISREIERRIARREANVEVTQERVIKELSRIAFAESVDGADGPLVLVDGNTPVDLAEKRRALVDVGKAIGLFTNKLEVTGKVTLEQLIDESMKDGNSPGGNKGDSDGGNT